MIDIFRQTKSNHVIKNIPKLKNEFSQTLCHEQNVTQVSGLVVLFYGVSTLFGSFNAQLNFTQYNLV